MKTKNNKTLFIVFVVAVALFLLFSGGAISGEMMNGMHGSGWMNDRTWMWIPARVTLAVGLALGLVLGWGFFRKNREKE